MVQRKSIAKQIEQLCCLFKERSSDKGTLIELEVLACDSARWERAHDLFQRIRRKNLEADRKRDVAAQAQYSFEESCAKTIYNLGRFSAPFDPDSPFWIAPRAFTLASRLGINHKRIIEILTGE